MNCSLIDQSSVLYSRTFRLRIYRSSVRLKQINLAPVDISLLFLSSVDATASKVQILFCKSSTRTPTEWAQVPVLVTTRKSSERDVRGTPRTQKIAYVNKIPFSKVTIDLSYISHLKLFPLRHSIVLALRISLAACTILLWQFLHTNWGSHFGTGWEDINCTNALGVLQFVSTLTFQWSKCLKLAAFPLRTIQYLH